jgi:subtilisin family serine protease
MSSPEPIPGGPLMPAPRRTRAAAVWALAVLALAASAHTASAAERSDSVLVRVDPSAPAPERADVRRALDAGSVTPLVAGWRAYDVPGELTLAQARRLLADAPAAEAVALDAKLQPMEVPNDALYPQQWSLPAIGAPMGWDASGSAAPVVVAVIDTGVQTAHPDLASRLWTNPGETPGNGIDDDANGHVDDVHGWNFFDDTATLYNASDGDSHGTHVAGTIAARRGNGDGIAGVADNARIMPLKFLKPGGGYTSDAMSAIQYATAEGATVINASWGGGSYSQPLCDAIGLAGDAGVLFVVAAGNGGPDAIGDDNDAAPTWPANCPSPNVISVAATTTMDDISSFSNYGAASVDIGAPGEGILSTVPSLTYGDKSGTSMATPHVSGVAAVVRGMHPGLSPWQLKAAIMTGGDVAPALAGLTVSGRRVDLAGALAAAGTGIGADTTPPDAFSPLAPADGYATAAPTPPLFSWTPSSDGQTGITAYRLVIDGAVVATTGAAVRSARPAAIADGVHTWTVVAVDGQGNTRATPARTLVVDGGAPSAPVLRGPATGARVPGPAVDLTWTPATDAVSGVETHRVVVDGVPVATLPGTAGAARVTMTHGGHTWQVVAVDRLGNQSVSAPRSLSVTGTIPALSTPSAPAARRLTLVAPSRLATGSAPLLRVRLPSAMRVTVSVRRARAARPVSTFRIRARAGLTTVRFPAAATRAMRRPGTYVVSARASTRLRDTVRITVGPRRR